MKTILITGGNKGIGLATAKRFIDAGHQVKIIARDLETFELKDHPQVRCFPFDLTQLDQLPRLVDSVGDIDVLVNNAGRLQPLTYDRYPDEAMNYSLALNVQAPVKLIELFAKRWLKQAQRTSLPRIVNNASIAGQIGHPDIWYGIAKAGLINATKSFAKAFEGKILVNAVAPSPTETDMLNSIPQHRQQAFLNTTISRRFATAQEVADTIFWLATDSPQYINGNCIDINNGSLPR